MEKLSLNKFKDTELEDLNNLKGGQISGECWFIRDGRRGVDVLGPDGRVVSEYIPWWA